MLKFDLARNALKFLIREYKIKEIYIPYYLCNVIRNAIFEEGCKPLFYHIDDSFMPVIKFSKDSFILYPNYFGICEKNVIELSKIYPNLIVDNAHSFYSHSYGFASIYAEHKFFPVDYGAYLLMGGGKKITNQIDIKRQEIFIELSNKYNKTNLLKFENIVAPFCYPYLAGTNEEADELANELRKQGKTIYRYWDALPKSYNEYKFYRRLVSIPLV